MKKKLLTLAALATMFAACSNNDVPVDETKDTPITILSAGVADLSTRATTTPLEGTTDNPVSMGVFITSETDNANYQVANAEWKHSGGTSWTTETATLYEGSSSTQQIYAYYPYVANMAGTIAVTASEQKDYLT